MIVKQKLYRQTNDWFPFRVIQFIGREAVIVGRQLRGLPVEGDIVLRLDHGSFIEVGRIGNRQRSQRGNQRTGVGGHLQLDLISPQVAGLIIDQDSVPAGHILLSLNPQPMQIRIKDQTFGM